MNGQSHSGSGKSKARKGGGLGLSEILKERRNYVIGVCFHLFKKIRKKIKVGFLDLKII